MKLTRYGLAIALAVVVGVATVHAQQGPVSQPAAPIGATSNDTQSSTSSGWTADQRALSGSQKLSLGSESSGENMIIPSLRFSQMFDSNVLVQPGDYGYEGVSSFSGSIALQRSTAKRESSLSYTGGGIFYSQRSEMNSSFHAFSASQRFTMKRFSLVFSDQFSYSPEAMYNQAGSMPGASFAQTQLVSGLIPDQSILTERGSRYSNSVAAETDYRFSARNSMSFTGSYGLMRFPGVDLLNGSQIATSAGFNHAFNSKDTMALSYANSQFMYDNSATSIMSHSMQLMYGRRLPGRLALQLSAGPQIAVVDGIGINYQSLFYAASASVSRNFGRSNVGLSYNRSVTSGSGVMIGAKTDSVGASLSHTVRRNWALGFSGGYSRNSGLIQDLTYQSMTAGATLSKSINRNASLFFGYSFQHQLSGSTCSAAALCADLDRHMFTFGLDWMFNPIRMK